MKFAIVVVALALAVGTESSVIPWGPALSYTAVSGPSLIAAAPGIATIGGPTLAVAAGPAAISVAPAPAIVAAAPIPLVAAQGSYVAQTRGAIHAAPLEGHANSAASINLQPAPGTI